MARRGDLYCWADSDYSRLPGLAQQLLDMKVEVIVTAGGPVSALAAKDATQKQKDGNRTPVVFTTVTDPMAAGSLNHFPNPVEI